MFEFFAGIAGWVLPLASIGIILFWAGAPITSRAGSIGPMLQRHRTTGLDHPGHHRRGRHAGHLSYQMAPLWADANSEESDAPTA